MPQDNRRRCPSCGKQFRRERGSNRTKCYTCSPPRTRRDDVVDEPAPEPVGPGPIEAQAVAALEAADRVDTIEGQTLLRLAREADADRLTGSQLASVSKSILSVAEVALRGARRREPDKVDELTARRLAKQAAAS